MPQTFQDWRSLYSLQTPFRLGLGGMSLFSQSCLNRLPSETVESTLSDVSGYKTGNRCATTVIIIELLPSAPKSLVRPSS